MATIDKITSILNTEIKMPFKIKARESVHQGNPFKDSSFALPADIFEGSSLKSQNKALMIMSAIAGSVSNFSRRITEPVSAFYNKVKSNTTATWNYLRNTTTTEFAHSVRDYVSSKMTSISERISTMKKNLEANKIENMSVLELESAWIAENELMGAVA